MEESVANVTLKYLDHTELSLRGFADALTAQLRNGTLSHNAVLRWRDGQSEPDTDFLCLCLIRYRDWRFDWALESLAAKRPEIWGPDGGIWTVAQHIHV